MRNSIWLRNGGVVALQTIVSVLVLFVSSRLAISHLGVELLGVWAIVSGAMQLLRMVDLGFAGAIVRFSAAAFDQPVRLTRLIETTFYTTSLLVGLGALFCCFFLPELLNFLAPAHNNNDTVSLGRYAAIAVWITSVGTVFQGVLEGGQFYSWRSGIIVVSQITFLATVWLGISWFGGTVLGVAAMLQAVVLLLGMYFAALCLVPETRRMSLKWCPNVFRNVVGFGINLQMIALLVALLDPVAKALVGHFSGLSAAAYMDMANKVVCQVRSLIVAGSQVIVPDIARLSANGLGNVASLYRSAVKGNTLFSTVLVLSLVLVAPLISKLWLGFNEPLFTVALQIIAVGTWLNLLSVPAYFLNVGTGRVSNNVVSHLGMVSTLVLLAVMLGSYAVNYGVVIAYASALGVGGAILLFQAGTGKWAESGDKPAASILLTETPETDNWRFNQ